jgi:hypothetical protein
MTELLLYVFQLHIAVMYIRVGILLASVLDIYQSVIVVRSGPPAAVILTVTSTTHRDLLCVNFSSCLLKFYIRC